MIKKYYSRFPHALRGLLYATTRDFGFRTQLYLGVAVVFIILAFLYPLNSHELLFILLSYGLVLITELQNSALEVALDRLHPELHNSIKISKDMTASAVLLAGLLLLAVLVVLALPRFI